MRGKIILRDRILEFLARRKTPISTRQLAIALETHWQTVQQQCLELLIEEKIARFDTTAAYLWYGKKEENKQQSDPTQLLNKEIDRETENLLKELLNKISFNKRESEENIPKINSEEVQQ